MGKEFSIRRKLLVISNLYPSKSAPFHGSFVKNFVDDLNDYNQRPVTICVLKGRIDGYGVVKILTYLLFYGKIFYRLLFFKYDLIYVHLITHASIPIRIVSYIKKLKQVLKYRLRKNDLIRTAGLLWAL